VFFVLLFVVFAFIVFAFVILTFFLVISFEGGVSLAFTLGASSALGLGRGVGLDLDRVGSLLAVVGLEGHGASGVYVVGLDLDGDRRVGIRGRDPH
jgi:hypothetical protein